ncbi:dUTPase [Candidatus Mycoplasma haematominutum]|uniref:dUTPase n=1 Tax=Candidatus Mycoplasma haematominutum 'Birmingham 1' TaxID=1116213 RepID=G8C3M6_9MOLU|nr:dUTPase [Candidatus Mycoplasma haematominutum]CCE66924.1 conserved hypothetical protein (dUTPase) [Candidatus Mycoplasma haematominutum 'Birmingham 1']
MRLGSLIKLQAQLDSTVLSLQNIKLEDHSILLSRKVALIVEFYEFLNETKLFKYWTNNPVNVERLREEYIDMLHFTLSLSIIYKKEEIVSNYELGVSPSEGRANMFVEAQSSQRVRTELLNIFADWMRGIHKAIEAECFEEWLGWVKTISHWLALTWEEIYSLYLVKWETNFARLGVKPTI